MCSPTIGSQSNSSSSKNGSSDCKRRITSNENNTAGNDNNMSSSFNNNNNNNTNKKALTRQLSVLKNASSLVRNVVGTEAADTIIHQNPIVGLSCILLMVVSLPMFTNGDIQFGIFSLCIGIGSFMADYVYANNLQSKWHDIDRLICVVAFLWNHGPFLVHDTCFNGNYLMGFCYALMVCGVPLSWSRASPTKRHWVYRHSTFHIFIAMAVSPLFLKDKVFPYMKPYMAFVPFYCFIMDPLLQKVLSVVLLVQQQPNTNRRCTSKKTTTTKPKTVPKNKTPATAIKRELAMINNQ